MALEILSSITPYLPHVKLPVPLRYAPEYSLNVFVDEELGLPLGISEPEVQQFFGDLEEEYTVVLDIGAHIGLYTVLAAQSPNSEVHTFEPNAHNFERLKENVTANNIGDRVTPINAAVSDLCGEVDFFISNKDRQHSLVSEAGERRGVDSVTLDSYCHNAGISPDLIKVDVEGGGHLVVDGASELFFEHTDWLVEIHSDNEATGFREAFEANDYEIEELNSSHWIAMTQD